ncbi:TRAP transporter substrate-binding protein DctP [Rhodococcus sp. NPDC057297]|uniref:TRAP transporter substrate-binding protein DctP n=1 Tax=Rhodococcus sp. NPDC057297 TaxID=3346090 RepID=UPI00364228A2
MKTRRRNHGGRAAPSVRVVSIGIAVALAASACSSRADDQPVVIVADGFSTSHPFYEYGTSVFVDELERNGPGVGLAVESFPSAQLGAFDDMPTMLTSGISDLSPIVPAYLSATAPMSSVFDLPGYAEDACTGARAMSRTLEEGSTLRTEEIDKFDVRPLYTAFLTGYELMTSEPVTDPRGQGGDILRSPGGAVDRVVEEMGAAGVSMPLSDLYEAVSRGTAEGTVASPTSMAPYGLAEVLRNSTVGSELGSVGVIYSMSDAKWDRLDDRQKAVVTNAGSAAQQSLCAALNRLLPESTAQMEQEGTTLHRLTPEEKLRWSDEVTIPARNNWRTDLDSMGLPASAVLAEWEAALEQERARE